MKKTWGRLTYDGWEKPALTDAGPSGQTFSCRTSASQSAESRRTTGRSESRTRCSPTRSKAPTILPVRLL